jgi:hypothetical protein
LLILGLVLEFGEAAQTDNEVIALNRKIEQIAPENLRINSLRADVSLWIRESDLANVPAMAKGQTPKEGVEFALTDSVADALNPKADFLAIMDCESFDEGVVIETPEGQDFSRSIKARSFAMTFSWPGVGFTAGHFAVHTFLRPWIYGDVSTADLDKKHPVAFISFGFMPANAEILRGTCVLTINGEIKRTFAIPAKTDVMRIVFPPMPDSSL